LRIWGFCNREETKGGAELEREEGVAVGDQTASV
jgi:hypothetical protein